MKKKYSIENTLSKLILIEKYHLLFVVSRSIKTNCLKNQKLQTLEITIQTLSIEKDEKFFSGRHVSDYDIFLENLMKIRTNTFKDIEIEEKKLYEIHKKLETVITKTKIIERIQTKRHLKWKKLVAQQEVIRDGSCLDL